MKSRWFRRLCENAGYSAVEAMTVVGAIGIVAAVAAPNVIRFQSANAVNAATWQVGGMLQWVRSRAINEATPYLVLFQQEEVVAGARSAFALIVRDSDRSYSVTPPDVVESFALDANVPDDVRQYGVAEGPAIYEHMPAPFEDRSSIARAGASSTAEASASESGTGGSSGPGGLVGKVGELVGGLFGGGSGSGSSGSETSGGGAESGREPVMAGATNGTTFPVSEGDGVPAVAFNERGIAVSPDSPEQWGSGAGAVYLTDNESAVYAAVVSPMGEVGVRRYEPATASWR